MKRLTNRARGMRARSHVSLVVGWNSRFATDFDSLWLKLRLCQPGQLRLVFRGAGGDRYGVVPGTNFPSAVDVSTRGLTKLTMSWRGVGWVCCCVLPASPRFEVGVCGILSRHESIQNEPAVAGEVEVEVCQAMGVVHRAASNVYDDGVVWLLLLLLLLLKERISFRADDKQNISSSLILQRPRGGDEFTLRSERKEDLHFLEAKRRKEC